jgi:hypothetical protein
MPHGTNRFASSEKNTSSFHRAPPLDQEPVRPSVLQDHGLVDHQPLEMRGRIVDGQAARLASVTMKSAANARRRAGPGTLAGSTALRITISGWSIPP